MFCKTVRKIVKFNLRYHPESLRYRIVSWISIRLYDVFLGSLSGNSVFDSFIGTYIVKETLIQNQTLNSVSISTLYCCCLKKHLTVYTSILLQRLSLQIMLIITFIKF